MEDYEKLGAFYLGRPYDLAAKKPENGIFLYDSKDLLTHAVCVGMTGSGKTGLCISLLEEAAIDGIPAIAIDPKGDLTNLLLTFPDLQTEDFLPWINDDDARQKGLSVEDYAARQAEFWKKGLADWGQSGERIRKLRESADFVIYTPGSTSGIPVSILKSFAPPPPTILEDEELLRERINTTVTSLLGIIGIEADPIKSREHILLSVLLEKAWKNHEDSGIAGLIQQIQNPPISRIGVMDLESFFPSRERFSLALALNNLLAAPGFNTWLEGETLDISKLLYSPAGKPRVAIFSIAHLNDPERMFFVSLLLNQVLGWMRTQSGTTSLRAILYMDEIFGFFPPVANPPSKIPLLTLLKQARAFGIGIVLATQNPVDLDYKGLANTGTWFIGRLQTERDKARLLDGLEGVAAGQSKKWDRQIMEQTLAGLNNRVFLVNNVHEDNPVIFETRWAMSYLRGPLTRNQIKLLTEPLRNKILPPSAADTHSQPEKTGQEALPDHSPGRTSGPTPAAISGGHPVISPGINEYFIPVRSQPPSGSRLLYQPALLGAGAIHFIDARSGLNLVREVFYLAEITNDPVAVTWDTAAVINIGVNDLVTSAQEPAYYAELPAIALKAGSYRIWSRDYSNWLYRSQKIELGYSPALNTYSFAGESERDFRIRLQHKARELSDLAVEKLRQKYTPRFSALHEQIQRAENAVERQKDQARQQEVNTAVSFGSLLMGSFLGRKKRTSATAAARGVNRSLKESGDIQRARDNLLALQQKMARLEADFQTDSGILKARYNPAAETLETVSIRAAKSNIRILLIALGWLPLWQNQSGQLLPAWE